MVSRISFALLISLAAVGCFATRTAPAHVPIQAGRHPDFSKENSGKVLVLPFTADREADRRHADEFQRALFLALSQSGWQDVQILDTGTLGRATLEMIEWQGELPVEMLIRLHREHMADAVLFGTVTYGRDYGPPAMGIRLILVDARNGDYLWVVNDVVDAQVTEVFRSYMSYQGSAEVGDSTQVPLSTFARFVANSVAKTLSEDEKL